MVIFIVMLPGITFTHEAYATCLPLLFTCDFTETVNVSDSPNNTVSKQLSETATISDTISTVTAFSKSLSEQLNVSDTLSTVTAFSQSLSEQVNISDTIATSGVFFRSLSEQVNISDTASPATAFSQSLSEQVNISDTAAKPITKSLSEQVNLSDTASTVSAFSKPLAETVNISDTFTTATAFSQSLSEQINISDTASKQITKSLSEQVNISDTFTTVTAFSQSLSEQVNISDTIATSGVFFRSLSEQVNISDTASLVTGFSKSLSDQVNISDTLNKLTNKEIIEIIRISDSLNIAVQTPKRGGGGGDSSPPSFGGTPNSETEYLFFNYGTGYRLSSYSNTLPTKLLETGKPQIIKLLLYEDSGPSAVEHIALYTNLRETAREIADSDTYIIYERNKPLQVNDPNKFFSNVNVTAATEDNKLAITFNMTFSKQMEKSDIILRAWDERRNSVDTRILDAWKVVEPQQESPPEKTVVDLLSDIKKWAGYSSSSISDSELLKDLGINAQQIPSWFKKTVRWLVSGETSIEEFADAIKYMHEKGIVK